MLAKVTLYSLSLHPTLCDQVTEAAPWCVTWAGCGNWRGLSAGAWAAARGTCPGSMSGQSQPAEHPAVQVSGRLHYLHLILSGSVNTQTGSRR